MTVPTENQIEISLGLIYKGAQASQIRAEWVGMKLRFKILNKKIETQTHRHQRIAKKQFNILNYHSG